MKKIFSFLFILNYTCAIADSWIQRASITGARDGAVGFSIDNKGYIGTGFNSGAMYYYKDFWEFDPDSNVWTQKADFGGGYRAAASGFSIGTKGYIGLGLAPSGNQLDFWEWDQANNTWSSKANFPSSVRNGSVGFSIGTKGYVGTGGINPPLTLNNDFWEWDGDTLSVTYNTWTQKSDFGGIARAGAVGFSIGTKGYIGTGSTDGTSQGGTKDFWEWDGDTLSATYNIWMQKADFGGVSRGAAAAFSIGQKGYIGTGTDTLGLRKIDFWEYDPAGNSWARKVDFGGAARYADIGFSIGNRGFIGMGFFFTVSTNDLWEYCDTCSGTGIEELNNFQFSFYPNPATNKIFISTTPLFKETTIEIFNQKGHLVFQKPLASLQIKTEINLPIFTNGIYFLKIQSDKNSSTQKIIIQN